MIGKPLSGDGGWLMLDHSYQDVGLFAEFHCTGGCETGALFRVEKTADGWKGIYVSLTEPDTPSYSVTLDAQGKILTRDTAAPRRRSDPDGSSAESQRSGAAISLSPLRRETALHAP